MPNKEFVQKLGFLPKNNASGIFYKKFSNFDYIIEVDFEAKKFNFGAKIKSESDITQNFFQEESWVVFECVNRLLEKGYKPEDIILEKTFKVGHGASGGRLDILVEKEGKAFLMIECKTFGKEFEKELKNINKNGGQLFTYFQNDTNAQYLMLYASQLGKTEIEFKNEIIKIEDHYRNAGNVADFYDRWSKITNQNGIFEEWVSAYHFENKLLTKKDLKILKDEDSGFIFNSFLSILRKHSVSDKPNAFNKIFNLFLAKILDEQKNDTDELDFQWKEKTDDAVEFQVRLINLHKEGIYAFLQKEIEGINDSDFFGWKTKEELKDKKKKWLIFNNIFAIKEVFDNETFEDNQKVLKEVVGLLQQYQIRYPRRQQHLSDFFERLLTTGLKQEAGQFFTPPPITKFIIKSIPLKEYIEKNLDQAISKLPAVIDYAAGSGHFITETMEAYQDIINKININSLHYPNAKKDTKKWQDNPYDWAAEYIYGIEKDYRLVKVAKVGCYFYGDGLAQIVYGDGLDNFAASKSFVGLLKENIDDPEKAKFSFVVSNPPYSVSSFKGDLKNLSADKDFTLYKYLTDNSSEIECLFIERTKQLLKEGGIAAVVLPSSILSNAGIYTKAREIILQNFEIIAITELGSNTFMATGTKTVVLFLKRRNNQIIDNLQNSVNIFFDNFQDITINGIENVISKYVNHTFENINFADYISLIKKQPNKIVENHEIFIEYKKKIKVKNEKEFWDKLIEIEKEKLLYFIIAYSQKVVLVKSGEKDAEKRFLGYEFSNRRGSEGIHPIQRGKTIDECTQLFDDNVFDNPEKASTYIYKAFENDFDFPIDESMTKNISRYNLIDMMTFDRADFEKTISLSVKKKLKIESKWDLINIGDVILEQPKSKIQVGTAKDLKSGNYNFFTSGESILKYNDFLVDGENIFLSTGGNALVKFFDGKAAYSTDTFVIKSNNENKIKTKFLFLFLENIISTINEFYFKGVGLKHLQKPDFRNIQISLPPKEIQEKIVDEMEVLERKEKKAKKEVEKFKENKNSIIDNLFSNNQFSEISKIAKVLGGKRIPKGLNFSLNRTEYPYIRVSDFKNGSVDISSLKYIDEDIFHQIKNYTISKNDLYISIAGTIGLVGLIPAVLEGKSLTENAAKIVITDTNLISKEYLYYCLISDNLQKQIKDNTRAVGVPKLALKRIETLKIPLLVLSEQQKIVAEIEKIENQISKFNEKLQEIKNQKKEVLKKYL